MSNFAPPSRGKENEPRINQQIRSPQIRLIDADGGMLGVVTVPEALRIAANRGLDLVEISPHAEPPVCKVMDFGKYKYELQKKQQEAKKKQKVVVVKEIKVRPNIDKHDLEIKTKHLYKFLEEGHKVKVTMMFRGREMDHTAIGLAVVRGLRDKLVEDGVARIESEPRMEGRSCHMMISPAKS